MEDKEFTAPSDLSVELKWTKVGHEVEISYDEGD